MTPYGFLLDATDGPLGQSPATTVFLKAEEGSIDFQFCGHLGGRARLSWYSTCFQPLMLMRQLLFRGFLVAVEIGNNTELWASERCLCAGSLWLSSPSGLLPLSSDSQPSYCWELAPLRLPRGWVMQVVLLRQLPPWDELHQWDHFLFSSVSGLYWEETLP